MPRVLLTGITIALALCTADPVKAPVAANPVVEIRGRITRVNAFGPGLGMPSVQVDVKGVSTTVMLGSLRFLMEQNFTARAGTDIQVKGYKLPAAVVAIEIRIPAENKIIRLRDDNGWPVWRGGGPPGYARGGSSF